jgi:hypothetical protein
LNQSKTLGSLFPLCRRCLLCSSKHPTRTPTESTSTFAGEDQDRAVEPNHCVAVRERVWSRRGALQLLAEPEPELLEYDVAAAAKTYRERRRARRRPPLRPAVVSILPNLLPRRGEPPTEFLVVLPFSPSLSRADAVVRVCFGCSLLQLVVCVVGTSTSSILVELRHPSLKGSSPSSVIS